MTEKILISAKDLAMLEAHLQQGLQMCNRLKKKLGPGASGPGSRKGLSAKKITIRRGILKRAVQKE